MTEQLIYILLWLHIATLFLGAVVGVNIALTDETDKRQRVRREVIRVLLAVAVGTITFVAANLLVVFGGKEAFVAIPVSFASHAFVYFVTSRFVRFLISVTRGMSGWLLSTRP